MTHDYKDLNILLVGQCFLKQNKKKYTELPVTTWLLYKAAVIPVS